MIHSEGGDGGVVVWEEGGVYGARWCLVLSPHSRVMQLAVTDLPENDESKLCTMNQDPQVPGAYPIYSLPWEDGVLHSASQTMLREIYEILQKDRTILGGGFNASQAQALTLALWDSAISGPWVEREAAVENLLCSHGYSAPNVFLVCHITSRLLGCDMIEAVMRGRDRSWRIPPEQYMEDAPRAANSQSTATFTHIPASDYDQLSESNFSDSQETIQPTIEYDIGSSRYNSTACQLSGLPGPSGTHEQNFNFVNGHRVDDSRSTITSPHIDAVSPEDDQLSEAGSSDSQETVRPTKYN
ncbi:hypothetical protein FB45DRAFT_878285 [Roridomyces roridus]|uniref:Uncharacterized protein n=1 Tax=Roridomyces roridus TaxID=1738132 RepID=A0AAD7F9L9_9AGAR|nr:hypothetical protein FB45DRAFT_878285 [Roridomyces roridus]